RFSSRVIEESLDSPEREKALAFVEKLYKRSGIQSRSCAMPDLMKEDAADFEFFPPNWRLDPPPTTEDIMALYEKISVDLGEQASRQALEEAGIDPEDVTHLVFCTCTGFFAPGPDILLGMRLGLAPTVQRTIIGFMGCYAGFNGMRTADQIVRSDPRAVVLQVSLELCIIHWQVRDGLEALVGNCLFADGCGATVYGAAERNSGKGLVDLRANYCTVANDSLDQMRWQVGSTGFEFYLSPEVPNTLGRDAQPFVEALLDEAAVSREEVSDWVVHPGGRKIVEAVRDALDLDDSDVEHAFGVLRDHGNMSSATIFFVLDRHLRNHNRNGAMVALGFGPGLTVEGAILDRC
ncbi:hypothetical protein LCGC14_2586550, partial [marine sediment metagenome]